MDDLRSNDSDCEASSVELASGAEAAKALPRTALAVSNRGVNKARAARGAVAGEDGDSDHGTTAEDVEDETDEGEERLAAKAAGENNCKYGVKNCRAR